MNSKSTNNIEPSVNHTDQTHQSTHNDHTQPPFPKTLAELTALDASNAIPFLKSTCDLLNVPLLDQNPTPAEALNAARQHFQQHQRRAIVEYPGGESAWTKTYRDLCQFISNMEKLCAEIQSSNQAGTTSGTQSGTHTGTQSGTPSGTPNQSTNSNPANPRSSTQPKADDSQSKTFLNQIEEFLADFDPSRKTKNRRKTATTRPFKTAPAHPKIEPSTAPGPKSNPQPEPAPTRAPDRLSALCQEISDELHKTNSPLDDLPPERQQKLFELLRDYTYSTRPQHRRAPCSTTLGSQDFPRLRPALLRTLRKTPAPPTTPRSRPTRA
jgi:hypothetical protein